MTETAQQGHVFAYYHTHWDREWYQSFREYQFRLARVVDAVIDRLESGELPCFMLDGQAVVLEDYLELRPENEARLRTLVRSGRLTVGPWYVAPDEFLVSGESLIRNLQRGIDISRAWGCDRFTGYLPDNFGHSGDMPMLLRGFGIGSAIVWRGVNPRHNEFFWQSPTGDRVLAYHLTDGYMQNMLIDPESTSAQRAEALTILTDKIAAASQTGLRLVPVGGDHLGPAAAFGRAVLKEVLPEAVETTPERFMLQLEKSLNGHALETVAGELLDNTAAFLLPGVYSARVYLKQENRRLEHLLTRQVEPLLAMAQAWPQESPRYPAQELDLLWKTLLLNHPHDSICGCGVDAVHRENEVRFEQARAMADVLARQARHHLNGQVADQNHWVVYNDGDQPFTGVVPVLEFAPDVETLTDLPQAGPPQTVLEDSYLYDISELPLSHKTMVQRQGWIPVENAPPHGFKVVPKKSVSLVGSSGSPDCLQNEFYRVEVAADGTLRVQNLRQNKQYTGFPVFQDRSEQGDSYNSAPVPGSKAEITAFLGWHMLENGPCVARLQLKHCLAGMDLTTLVTLSQGSRRIEFETVFTNLQPDHKLQVLFHTGQPIHEVWAESHFGVVRRAYTPDYHEEQAMPVERMKELRTNTGPIQRFFRANGHGFITEGLAEYEVYGESLAITLVRAFGALSSGDTGVRGAQAGPPFATPEGQCLGRTLVCRYAWLPEEDPATLYEESLRFYGAVRGYAGRRRETDPALPTDWSLLRWENPSVISSALHWQPGQGLVARLVNITDVPQTIMLFPGFDCVEVVALDLNLRPLDPDAKIKAGQPIHFAPRAVQTLLLKR